MLTSKVAGASLAGPAPACQEFGAWVRERSDHQAGRRPGWSSSQPGPERTRYHEPTQWRTVPSLSVSIRSTATAADPGLALVTDAERATMERVRSNRPQMFVCGG